MADELKTNTTITEREIMKGYARNVTLADREKEVDEKLKAFAEGSQAINRALSKTVQVPAPTKEDRTKTRGENRTLTQQLRTANREYMNAQPEQRAQKRQAMYSLLGNALRNKGEVPARNPEGQEVKGVQANNDSIVAYGDALAKHLKGEYAGDLEGLKTAAVLPDLVGPHTEDQKAQYEANKRYLKQLNDTKELAKSIAATESLVDARELRLAAIRALDFLQDDALSNSGIALADLAGGGDARNIGAVGLNQIGETVKGGWWNPGKDGDSGSYGFDADLGAAGATKLIAALINNKGMGKGADVGGIVFTNGTQDARRGAFRTAFACGIEFEFEDTQAYKEFVPGDPRPRECHILAMKFQEKARKVRRENNGVIDHGRVYAELFADSEATGFNIANGTFDENAKSAARVRREFWHALVHTRAGHTGASLYSKLRQSISKDTTTGRAMAIAMKGIHEKLKEQFPAANQKADLDKAFTAIIDDASKTIGTENFVNIVFSGGPNAKKSNTEFLGTEARKDIAKHFMTQQGKYADYVWYQPQFLPTEVRIKRTIAAGLFEEETREIAKDLAGTFYSQADSPKEQAKSEKSLGIYLNSLDSRVSNKQRVDFEKIEAQEPEKTKLFSVVESNLEQAEVNALIAKQDGVNNQGDLDRLTLEQAQALCEIDSEKIVNANDGARNMGNYTDGDKAALRTAYKAADPARAVFTEPRVDAALVAMPPDEFKAFVSGVNTVDPSKLKAQDPLADMTNFTKFESGLLRDQNDKDNAKAVQHGRPEQDFATLTVKQLKVLCVKVNGQGFNPKKAALDEVVDQAIAVKVQEYNAAHPPPADPVTAATLPAAERAAALLPVMELATKGVIATNLTGRTTGTSINMKQAARKFMTGLVMLPPTVFAVVATIPLFLVSIPAVVVKGKESLSTQMWKSLHGKDSLRNKMWGKEPVIKSGDYQKTAIIKANVYIAERGLKDVPPPTTHSEIKKFSYDKFAYKAAMQDGMEDCMRDAGIGFSKGDSSWKAPTTWKMPAVSNPDDIVQESKQGIGRL